MKAKEFYEIYKAKLRPPTDRKIINLARKLNLTDTQTNVVWFTGLPYNKAKEFIEKKGA